MWTAELVLMLLIGGFLGWFVGFAFGAEKGKENDEALYWQIEAEKWARAFYVLQAASEQLDSHLVEKLNRRNMGRYEEKTATVLGRSNENVKTVHFTTARIHRKGKWIEYGDD